MSPTANPQGDNVAIERGLKADLSKMIIELAAYEKQTQNYENIKTRL